LGSLFCCHVRPIVTFVIHHPFIGAQGNGLLPPALGIGLPLRGLGLLENV
jgi:hypothetical protein